MDSPVAFTAEELPTGKCLLYYQDLPAFLVMAHHGIQRVMVTNFPFLELCVPGRSQNYAVTQFPKRTNNTFLIGTQCGYRCAF